MLQTNKVTAFILAPATGDPAPETPAAILARLAVPALPAHVCNHDHTDFYETGGFFMGADGPDDNIQTHFFCLDCGVSLPAPAPVAVSLLSLADINF